MFTSTRRLTSYSFMGAFVAAATSYDFANMPPNVQCFTVKYSVSFFIHSYWNQKKVSNDKINRNHQAGIISEGNMRIKFVWCHLLRKFSRFSLLKRKERISTWAIWISSKLYVLTILPLNLVTFPVLKAKYGLISTLLLREGPLKNYWILNWE